jgi:putative ABC transport system permease protein
VRRRLPTLSLGGVAIGALGAVLLVPAGSLALSFAGLFAIMVGCALLVPAGTVALMRAVRPVAAGAFGALGRLAAAGVGAALSRTAPALAALMVAVAAVIALGAMIGSFRGSVVAWLDTTLSADVYVSAPGSSASRPEGALDAALVARIRAAPGVSDVATYRAVELPTATGPLRLGVLAPAGTRSRATYRLAAGDAARAWSAFEAGDAFVSEPFAYRARVGVGDSVTIPTDRGPHTLRVAGVFIDYGPDQGVVLVHRATWDALFDDRSVGSLAVYADAGADADALVDTLRAAVAGAEQRLFIRANRTLRDASLEVFDRTFAITAVLRVLAVIVAFVGVLAALTALQLERAREFGVLRAAGVTPGQLWAMVTAQTGLMGLAAGLLATPVGALVSAIMIHVVNRRSFGWSLDMMFPAGLAAQGVALAVAAALLAGIVPAWRLARTPPARALREE